MLWNLCGTFCVKSFCGGGGGGGGGGGMTLKMQ
jgi:hypothetical protein